MQKNSWLENKVPGEILCHKQMTISTAVPGKQAQRQPGHWGEHKNKGLWPNFSQKDVKIKIKLRRIWKKSQYGP